MPSVVGEVDVGALSGFYKQRYADQVERAVPIETVLANKVKWRFDEAEGDFFNQAVNLSQAHGFSYALTGAGAFSLNLPLATVYKNAQVQGAQIMLRHSLSYETAAKAQNNEQAFGRYIVTHMLDMKEAFMKRLEIELMYGQYGLGTANNVATNPVVITTAEWAPGIWSGMENAKIQVYATSGGAPTATLRASPTSITSVDLDNKTVTLNSVTAIAVSDVILFGVDGTNEQWDGTVWNTALGLHKIAATTSGNLFAISSTTYSLWRANQLSAASADLSFGLIQKARAKSMGKGDTGDCICICNPTAWANLMTNQAALRRYGAERRSFENGAEAIRFYSQSGSIDIVSSIYCKEGYAYLIQPKKLRRIGPTDVTFDLGKMGLPGGQIFRHMDGNAGIEFRAYSHQALFTSKPGCVTLINNIVNS
jgi:hypothetical protein